VDTEKQFDTEYDLEQHSGVIIGCTFKGEDND
jgi:hypothetical protein